MRHTKSSAPPASNRALRSHLRGVSICHGALLSWNQKSSRVHVFCSTIRVLWVVEEFAIFRYAAILFSVRQPLEFHHHTNLAQRVLTFRLFSTHHRFQTHTHTFVLLFLPPQSWSIARSPLENDKTEASSCDTSYNDCNLNDPSPGEFLSSHSPCRAFPQSDCPQQR